MQLHTKESEIEEASTKKNKFEVIANALTPEQYENLMENIELLCWDEKAKAYY